MFYIKNKINNEYGIVDSEDGVCEYFSEDYIRDNFAQIVIEKQPVVTEKHEYKMRNKLLRSCKYGGVEDFFKLYSLPSIDSVLFTNSVYIEEICKCYDYSETKGYYILRSTLRNCETNDLVGTILIRIHENKDLVFKLFNINFRSSYIPCANGTYYNYLMKIRYNILSSNLRDSHLYLLCYSDLAYFLDAESDFSVVDKYSFAEDLR